MFLMFNIAKKLGCVSRYDDCSDKFDGFLVMIAVKFCGNLKQSGVFESF
jgi:hypothetical protein